MISILTPTIRPDGLRVVDESIRAQTFKDFEWLIGSPFDPAPYVQHPHRWVKDDFKGGKWTLNRVDQALFDASTREYLLNWQDYTTIKPNTLSFLANIASSNKLYSVLGNKYEEGIPVWIDPRFDITDDDIAKCKWDDIEFNFAFLPRRAVDDVGGYDVESDMDFIGMDGLSVVDRINDLGGYEFYKIQSPQTYSHTHGRPQNWDRNHGMNGLYARRKKRLISLGHWPIIKK